MNTTLADHFRFDRPARPSEPRRVTPAARPSWRRLVLEGALYFGVTLSPLLAVIVLFEGGVLQ